MRNRRYLQKSTGSAYGVNSLQGKSGGVGSAQTSKIEDPGSNLSGGDYSHINSKSSYHTTNYLNSKKFRNVTSAATSGIYPVNSLISSKLLKTSPTSYDAKDGNLGLDDEFLETPKGMSMSYNRIERIFYPTEIDKRYLELEREVSKMTNKIKKSMSIEKSIERRMDET